MVNPTIEALEVELASTAVDNMSEVTVRAKLKYVNTLKYFFSKVFLTLE